jgi:hypothetical protein
MLSGARTNAAAIASIAVGKAHDEVGRGTSVSVWGASEQPMPVPASVFRSSREVLDDPVVGRTASLERSIRREDARFALRRPAVRSATGCEADRPTAPRAAESGLRAMSRGSAMLPVVFREVQRPVGDRGDPGRVVSPVTPPSGKAGKDDQDTCVPLADVSDDSKTSSVVGAYAASNEGCTV